DPLEDRLYGATVESRLAVPRDLGQDPARRPRRLPIGDAPDGEARRRRAGMKSRGQVLAIDEQHDPVRAVPSEVCGGPNRAELVCRKGGTGDAEEDPPDGHRGEPEEAPDP